MAADILPLKGAIANLNWFDAQRKHYETPDQIARRFRLPDDAGMRAFCQGAATMLDRSTIQFVRRLPLTTDAASSYLNEPEKIEQWLPDTRWNLETGGTQFELNDATDSARARRDIPNYQGPITELQVTDTLPASAEVPTPLQDTTAEQVAQPGGPGTHWVSLVADWHQAVSLLQKLTFAAANTHWPPELAVALDRTALIATYAKLLAAYHKG